MLIQAPSLATDPIAYAASCKQFIKNAMQETLVYPFCGQCRPKMRKNKNKNFQMP
ncbi:hypothetical protein VFPPC_16029 [Pochonia chlamydosporia 170]|uniref:Uncharacterized protein n=1 Tax=Pochonia chlamydosporia 170 TaxID=1380566 RepID=A0A179FN45_METCM|nr:hypothetical protein VFPPC_16029 [Pochonia chlamydosporia 170]OAQ66439.1 hypothetical protein VFPPC_16029 [Pochonia chlamydosporia 170]